MTAKEAIEILRNAAFLGTDEDREKIEAAIDMIEKYLEMFRWHPYPDEKTEKETDYLCAYYKGYHPFYEVNLWRDDLYALDKFDFAEYKGKKEPGFAIYNSEYGWGECRPDAWMPIPGNDKE